MVLLKLGRGGVMGVKEEKGSVVGHTAWNTYQEDGCVPCYN